MTFTLSSELERDLVESAQQLGVSPEEMVRRAVAWFLQAEPELSAELSDWQRMTWKAWDTVEESLR
jgi:predicted transcriptional regulator